MSLPGHIEVDIDCNTSKANGYRCSNNNEIKNTNTIKQQHYTQ